MSGTGGCGRLRQDLDRANLAAAEAGQKCLLGRRNLAHTVIEVAGRPVPFQRGLVDVRRRHESRGLVFQLLLQVARLSEELIAAEEKGHFHQLLERLPVPASIGGEELPGRPPAAESEVERREIDLGAAEIDVGIEAPPTDPGGMAASARQRRRIGSQRRSVSAGHAAEQFVGACG